MIEIKHRTTGEVLRTVDADTLRGADIRGVKISAHALAVLASALGIEVTP